jgi:hypothetical protein
MAKHVESRYHEDEEFRPSKREKKRDVERRKEKRLKNALRNADLDVLIDQEH